MPRMMVYVQGQGWVYLLGGAPVTDANNQTAAALLTQLAAGTALIGGVNVQDPSIPGQKLKVNADGSLNISPISSSTTAVTAVANAFVDGAIATLGTEADTPNTTGTGNATAISLLKGIDSSSNAASTAAGTQADTPNTTGTGNASEIALLKGIDSAANAASAATGTQADAAYTTGSGSIISVLKGIFVSLANILLMGFDSVSRLRISNYAQHTTAGDTSLQCDASGNLYVNLLNTSGTPVLGFVTLRQAGAAVSAANPGFTTTGGGSTQVIAAGKSTDTVIKASAGFLGYILVTTTGTNPLQVFDNASAGSGNLIGALPASPNIGVYGPFLPATAGITVKGNAANPAVTISFG